MLKASSGAPKSYWSTPAVGTRFFSEVEEEEEETEQMDLEEQPSRFQGHFRPRRYCASILRGGPLLAKLGVHFRALVMTSSTRMHRDIGDGLSSSSPSCSFL